MATAVVGRVLFGLGFFTVAPLFQAYVGRAVAPLRIGRVTGIIESSWALSSLVGIYLVALTFDNVDNWRVPFIILAALMFPGAIVTWLVFDGDHADDAHGAGVKVILAGVLAGWRAVFRHPATFILIFFAILVNFTNTLIFTNFGRWLEEVHEMDTEQIGRVSIGIGVSELVGAAAVSLYADRFGLRRSLVLSTFLMIGASIGLALTADDVVPAVAFFYFLFLQFEIVIITTLSYTVHLVPEAPGAAVSLVLTFFAVGRLIGPLVAGPAFEVDHMATTAWVSVGCFVALFGLSVLLPTVTHDEEAAAASKSAALESEASQSFASASGSSNSTATPTSSSSSSSSAPSSSSSSSS